MTLLESINSPADLRALQPDQLRTVADEIRTYILETMSRVGGHTGASLGAVELAVALHYAFDTPRDRFWLALDVSAFSLVAAARLADEIKALLRFTPQAPALDLNGARNSVRTGPRQLRRVALGGSGGTDDQLTAVNLGEHFESPGGKFRGARQPGLRDGGDPRHGRELAPFRLNTT